MSENINKSDREYIINRIEKFLGNKISGMDKYQRNKFNFILDTDCVNNVESKINLFVRLDKFHAQEIIRQKDLYEMNTAELKEILNFTSVTNANEQAIIFYALKKYMEYQMDRGEILTNINPLISLSAKDITILKRLLSTKYITEDQLYDLIENNNERIKDIQNEYENVAYALTKEVIIRAESLLISLLYSGVMGVEATELINLKDEDLDFENKKIKTESNVLDMHDSVQANYYNYLDTINNYNRDAASSSRFGMCIDRGYVFKCMENDISEQYDIARINRYIKDCKENTRYSRITPLTIKDSGIFNYLWNLEHERGEELKKEEITNILENKFKESYYRKYNLPKVYRDYKIAKTQELEELEEVKNLQKEFGIEL